MTLKELKALKEFKVKRHYMAKFTKDDIDELREHLKAKLIEHGINPNELVESDNSFSWNNRVWLKPKMQEFLEGTIKIRSKDYLFIYEREGKIVESYGPELKASMLTDNGFFIEDFRGNKVFYEIVK